MRNNTIILVAAVSILFSPHPAAPADANPALEEAVRDQAEIIRELREELTTLREDQTRNDNRVRALEDQIATPQASTGGAGEDGVTREYVDHRIDEFLDWGESRFFMSGYGSAQYVDPLDGAPSTFGVRFNPTFHFALTDSLHFNAELEIELAKEESADGHGTETTTEVALEFATIDYLATDWLTLSAGQFLTPFNVFGPKLHPQWINKMASSPPIYGGHHGGGGGIIPILSDVGVMVSGGHELWNEDSKFNYAFYFVNGATLETEEHDEEEGHGEEEEHAKDEEHGEEAEHKKEEEHGEEAEHAEEAGHGASGLDFVFGNTPDDNDNKAFGGRIGFLPIPNLEIGASFQTGKAGSGGDSDRYNLLGFDAWYWWKGLELRGEFIRLSQDSDGSNPNVWGYYAQAAYRLSHLLYVTQRDRGSSGSRSWERHIAKLEPVLRWGEIEAFSPRNREQLALGLNYWLFESVPLKFTYEINSGNPSSDRFLFQVAFGF